MAMLKSALSEAAAVAVRTGTFLGERYRRIVKRSPGYYAIHIGQDRKAHHHVASWRPSAHPLSAAGAAAASGFTARRRRLPRFGQGGRRFTG
jgi:hypothetical protein